MFVTRGSSSFRSYLFLSRGCSVQVHPLQPPAAFPKTPAPGALQEELPPHKAPTLPLDQVGQWEPGPCSAGGGGLVGPVPLGLRCAGSPTPRFALAVGVSCRDGTWGGGRLSCRPRAVAAQGRPQWLIIGGAPLVPQTPAVGRRLKLIFPDWLLACTLVQSVSSFPFVGFWGD